MAAPSSAITRYELSAPYTEFDLMMNRKKFIGLRVLRPRIVGVQAADVGKIPLKELLRQRSTKRAPGGGYGRDDFEFDKFAYATEEYGYESAMDDRQIKIFRDLLDAEGIHADRAIDGVVQEYERDVASAVFNTTTWTGAALTTALGTPWSTHASATPITDIFNAKEKVVTGSGLAPNALILNAVAYFHLRQCAQIVDRIKYGAKATQAEIASALAEMLEIEQIIVAGGLTNTANAQQTAAISRIWSNTMAMVARVAMTDDPAEPCIGRTFIWNEDGPGSPGADDEIAVVVEEYREEKVRGSVIRARNDRDIVIQHAAAGHLLTAVTA